MPESRTFSSPCYCTNLRKAARAVSALYDAALAPGGLRVTQFSLLRHVQRLGPVTLSTLTRALRLERTTLVRNLTLLKKQGLIAEQAATGRAGQLCLTEKGETLLDRTVPLWHKAQESVKAALSQEERATLRQLLAKLESAATGI